MNAPQSHSEQSPPSDERRVVLLRRLIDARSILGCGDDPDRTAAIDEIERLEAELAELPESTPSNSPN
jgi:hypothetical protein